MALERGRAGRAKIAGPAMSGASMPLRHGGDSAVDQDVSSSDEGGGGADQPFHGRCDIGRCAYSRQRCALQLLGNCCGAQLHGSRWGRDNVYERPQWTQ
jgi:hypothetical protein